MAAAEQHQAHFPHHEHPHHEHPHHEHPHHERHHRTLTETIEGQDKINGAESVSSSRSSTSSDEPPARDIVDDTSHSNEEPFHRVSASGIAYDIKLHCRSNDPIADLQTLEPEALPSHWVPSVMSQVSRATWTAFGQNAAPRHSTSSRNQQEQSQPHDNKTEEHHILQRLTFRNPWQDTFRKPSIKAVFHGGLKWGLPDSYTEGSGKGDKRASGFKSNKKIQRQLEIASEEDRELGEGWDSIEVVQPQWGWPEAHLKREVDQIRQEELEAHPSKQQNEQLDRPEVGASYKAKEETVQDWKDPKKPGRVAARVTWLGHASTLLQLPPLPTSANGHERREDMSSRWINILFDPIFSERCSRSQAAGPQRFTPAPCTVDELPPIDIVVISHSHYDHLDSHTFEHLHRRFGETMHAFVPLGVKEKITGSGGFGWSKTQVSELDWWDSAQLSLASAEGAEVKVTCTPAQHGSGRGAADKDASLWASWVVEWSAAEDRLRFCAFFAGDTGLKYHHDNPHKRHKYPACPAFGEIAQKFAAFDLLLLPISVGSSLSYFRSWDPFPRAISPFPRVSNTLTSSIHMDPHDAVECHGIFQREKRKDGRAMMSLAVHYGTFVRNDEQTSGDVRELRKACKMKGLKFVRVRDGRCLLKRGDVEEESAQVEADDRKEQDAFLVADQGKSVWLPIHSSDC